jgi:hypothetical protein
MSRAAKRQKVKPPPFQKISEHMREWSAMLQSEIETWPNVSAKKMFGMISVYRGKQIFAALPYTRTLVANDSFMFKFERAPAQITEQMRKDSRILGEHAIGTRWFIFQMSSPADLHSAIEWLALAYEHVPKTRHR